MNVHIKPAVLTMLVGIIVVCNIHNPISLLSCLLLLVAIYMPQLDGASFQLDLIKSTSAATKLQPRSKPPTSKRSASKFITAAKLLPNVSGPFSASIQSNRSQPESKLPVAYHPLLQQEEQPPVQLAHKDKLAKNMAPTKVSRMKSKKKLKGVSKALANAEVAVSKPKEAVVADQTFTASTDSDEGGGEWQVVTKKKRHIAQRLVKNESCHGEKELENKREANGVWEE